MIKVLLNITAAELKELSDAAEQSEHRDSLMIEVTDTQLKIFERPSPNDKGRLIKYLERSVLISAIR